MTLRQQPAAQSFQAFGALPDAIESALRASISRFGVLMPVAVDQHNRILDGHHRRRIAAELGFACPTKTIHVDNDEHAREIARTLNEDRRQLPVDQRIEAATDLREKGHSLRAIAGALGVSHTQVAQDLATVKDFTVEQVTGLDGKKRTARPKQSKEKKPRKRQAEAKKPSPPPHAAPAEETVPLSQYKALAEKYDELVETLEDYAHISNGDAAKEMKVLHEKVRLAERRRDELMNECKERGRQIELYKRELKKLGWKGFAK